MNVTIIQEYEFKSLSVFPHSFLFLLVYLADHLNHLCHNLLSARLFSFRIVLLSSQFLFLYNFLSLHLNFICFFSYLTLSYFFINYLFNIIILYHHLVFHLLNPSLRFHFLRFLMFQEYNFVFIIFYFVGLLYFMLNPTFFDPNSEPNF